MDLHLDLANRATIGLSHIGDAADERFGTVAAAADYACDRKSGQSATPRMIASSLL